MATYYAFVRYNVNGGKIPQNPYYNSTSFSRYTSASTSASATTVHYFKATSTTANITSCATSGGTYSAHGSRHTGSSTSATANLVNVSSFGVCRDGYHITSGAEYRVGSSTATSTVNQDSCTLSKLGAKTSPSSFTTLYMNWTGNGYTVHFDAHGGTGTMSDETGFVYGTAKALTSNSFTRTGYTFNGWNTSSTGSGYWEYVTRVASGDSISISATTLRSSISTLYGYWNSTWYKWDGSDFVSATAPASYSSGSSSYSSCSPLPTTACIEGVSYISVAGRTYCMTHGENASSGTEYINLYRWNPGQSFSNGASITTLQSCPINGDTITLYAQWTPNNYYVLLDDNAADGDGTGLTTLTMTYGSTANNSVTPPTRFGHTFEGYYDTEGEIVYNSSGNAVAGTYWNGSVSTVFSVTEKGPCTADHIGTNGTDIFLKDGSQYYQVSVDNSNSYILLSSTPSVDWVAKGSVITYQGANYYFIQSYSDSAGVDRVYIYRYNAGTTWKSASNVPLMAVWIPKVKSYILDPNGGTYNSTTGTTTKNVTFNTSENSSPGVATRTGYIFNGWYFSTGNSQQIFNSSGSAVPNILEGPWYNARPTALASNAYYLHYGDYIWGVYNDGSKTHLAYWADTSWTEVGTCSATSTTLAQCLGQGNLVSGHRGTTSAVMVTGGTPTVVTGLAANVDVWNGSVITSITPLYSQAAFSSGIPVHTMSTTLPNEGSIWIADHSTPPTYYAHWTGVSYSVAFNANGGSGTMSTQTGFVYGTAKALNSNTFTAPAGGYAFQGWATTLARAKAGTVDYANGASMTTGTTTNSGTCNLYAVWKRTIYFRSGTGQGATGSYDQYYGGSLTTPAVTAISGWSTLGWRDDSTASTSEYAASSTVTYSGTATTFYGVYSRTLTQSYNANGGSGTAPAAKTATQYYNAYGNVSTATFAAQANTFTAPTGGWSFYVWSTDSSPTSGTTYTATASPTWAPAASSTTTSRTLYVRWQRILYFESGISEAQEDSTYQYRGSSTYTTVTFPTPAALSTSGTSWTALGWRTDTTAATNQYSAGSLTFKGYATRFNAIYERIVQISFSANGGTGTPPESVGDWQYYNSYGNLSSVILTIPANTFTRPGYTFSSWDIGSPGLSVAVHPALNDYSFLNSNAMWIPRIYIKQNGTWKESVPQIKVSGTWKTPTAMYVKVNGTWKQIY